MADWCFYSVGFNSGSLVDLVTQESLKSVFEVDEPDYDELEEDWSDKGYGFCTPMNFENENEELLYELGDEVDPDDHILPGSDGEVEIQSNHPNLGAILEVVHGLTPKYYGEQQTLITKEEFLEQIAAQSNFVITLCELEGPV